MGTVASTLRNICCCCRVSEKKDNSKFPRSPGRENPQLPNILKDEENWRRAPDAWSLNTAVIENPTIPSGRHNDLQQLSLNPTRYTREPSRPQPLTPRTRAAERRLPISPLTSPELPLKVVAVFDYDARCHNELTFRRGDVMTIHEQNFPQQDTWIDARLIQHPYTNGKIPSNFVMEYDHLSYYEWYFGNFDRKDAERMLLSSQNLEFSFLVRPSSRNGVPYSLSVNRGNKVAHFKIHENERRQLFIHSNAEFESLPDLILHYQNTPDHIGYCLGEPCKRSGPRTNGLSSDLAGQWELDRTLLKLEGNLGNGNFGEVYLGEWNNQTKVAVKQLKEDTNDAEDFLREAGALKKIRHPNIVQLYGVCTTEQPFLLVTEFMVNGDLKKYLKKGAGKQLPEERLIDIGVQVASGMAYLEAQNFVHRDLAARNVLVGNDNVCKVADFGMAELMEYEYYQPNSKNFARAVRWTAPEVFLRSKFSTKSDVWSFGVCLFEIIEKGEKPYKDCHQNHQVQEKVERGEIMEIELMPNCSPKLYKYMKLCWKFYPVQRPTFAQLLKYLSNFWGSSNEEEDFTDLNESINNRRVTMLAEGNFGNVTKESQDNVEVVQRHIHFEMVNEDLFDDVTEMMKSFDHSRLVRVLETYFDNETGISCITSEPMQYRTLLDAVTNGGHRTVSDSTKAAAQIASGMAYLEKNNFVHGNLAARNVYMDKNNDCKVADYGLRTLSQCFNLPVVEAFSKSLKWTAPEILQNETTFTIKSDVWAFGICLFEITEKGREPYSGLSDRDAAEAVATGHRITFDEMEFCPGKFFSVMQKCWNTNSLCRPSFAELTVTLHNLYR